MAKSLAEMMNEAQDSGALRVAVRLKERGYADAPGMGRRAKRAGRAHTASARGWRRCTISAHCGRRRGLADAGPTSSTSPPSAGGDDSGVENLDGGMSMNCGYCSDEIKPNESAVMRNGKPYHPDCVECLECERSVRRECNREWSGIFALACLMAFAVCVGFAWCLSAGGCK